MHFFLTPEELMAKMLKKGLKGFSIDESLIYEIFTTCTQEELKLIESTFKKETGKDLIREIEKNFPSAIRKNLINLLNIPRSNNENPNKVQCEKLAQILVDNVENSWVANEEIFKKYYEHSQNLRDAYGNEYRIQTPYNNCLHVFIGDVREDKTKIQDLIQAERQLYQQENDIKLFVNKIENKEYELNCLQEDKILLEESFERFFYKILLRF